MIERDVTAQDVIDVRFWLLIRANSFGSAGLVSSSPNLPSGVAHAHVTGGEETGAAGSKDAA